MPVAQGKNEWKQAPDHHEPQFCFTESTVFVYDHDGVGKGGLRMNPKARQFGKYVHGRDVKERAPAE